MRFRGRVGERLFLGTNHAGSTQDEQLIQERQLIDSCVRDVVSRQIETAYIEGGGLSSQDNLLRWLEENGYKTNERTTYSELAYAAESLTGRGVQVVNMDLAYNPSALPFAIERFGLERTARDLNWHLNVQAMGLLDPTIDKIKIPEIVTRLIAQAGGNVTQEQIELMIQGRDMMNDDYFTDDEREEYMVSLIKDKKSVIAAHTGHTTALLNRMIGDQKIEDTSFYVDADKIHGVLAAVQTQSERRSSANNP